MVKMKESDYGKLNHGNYTAYHCVARTTNTTNKMMAAGLTWILVKSPILASTKDCLIGITLKWSDPTTTYNFFTLKKIPHHDIRQAQTGGG